MIRDRKAEELESKGLYRRAAARWMEGGRCFNGMPTIWILSSMAEMWCIWCLKNTHETTGQVYRGLLKYRGVD